MVQKWHCKSEEDRMRYLITAAGIIHMEQSTYELLLHRIHKINSVYDFVALTWLCFLEFSLYRVLVVRFGHQRNLFEI